MPDNGSIPQLLFAAHRLRLCLRQVNGQAAQQASNKPAASRSTPRNKRQETLSPVEGCMTVVNKLPLVQDMDGHRPAAEAERLAAVVEAEIDAMALDRAPDVADDREAIAFDPQARPHRDHPRIDGHH